MTEDPGSATRRWSAQGERGGVHFVDASPEGLKDPATYHTYCGDRIFEIYNDSRAATCSTCLTRSDPEVDAN